VAEPLIIDANPIISALLGGSARRVVLSPEFSFYSTQHTLFEVEKYLPWLARRLDRGEIHLFREFELLPIIACQPTRYESQVAKAESLIGLRDIEDVPILALALELGYPIWTEDHDFDGIPEISVRRTADLLATL
jgi:predicted nucleic acid-binding protein